MPVTWLGPFVEARVSFRDLDRFRDGYFLNPRSLEVFGALEAELQGPANRALRDSAGIEYVSLVDGLKITPDFLRQGECVTYQDVDHFSRCGEAIVGERLLPLLRATGARAWLP
jgi:hypothetical protein